ncbi:MAG: hypothetical protein H0T53_06025 [Herpetosiphonaceae bacterium]|nr:hypothetical protein [Herpetosiphonaceae bacterium]
MNVRGLFQRWRGYLALSVVIGFVLLSGLRLLYVAAVDRVFYDRLVKEYPSRLELARGLLPPEGEIGYLSDDPDSAFIKRYLLTQYELAPLVVRTVELPELGEGYISPDVIQTTGNRYPIILGYFTDPRALEAEMQQNNLALVHQIDANIVILEQR